MGGSKTVAAGIVTAAAELVQETHYAVEVNYATPKRMTTLDHDEGKRIQVQYKDWIADDAKIALGKDDVIYMHPLPADREIEVANSVIDGPHSVVFDEAENRLHAQKAVMALTM